MKNRWTSRRLSQAVTSLKVVGGFAFLNTLSRWEWEVWKMSKITAIEPQQKDPQRVNVYLDGEFAFGLARITAGWLTVGQELGEEKVASLLAEDANKTAYQKALHFLSYRPRSSSEVRQN